MSMHSPCLSASSPPSSSNDSATGANWRRSLLRFYAAVIESQQRRAARDIAHHLPCYTRRSELWSELHPRPMNLLHYELKRELPDRFGQIDRGNFLECGVGNPG